MDDALIKHIISPGEIIERFLINTIKLRYFEGEERFQIISENKAIKAVLDELVLDISIFDDDQEQLLQVLQRQWELLDKVHNVEETIEVRGRYAIEAQELNVERVKYKNNMNCKSGFAAELKSYKRRNNED